MPPGSKSDPGDTDFGVAGGRTELVPEERSKIPPPEENGV